MRRKPLTLNACPAPSSSSISLVAQPINRSPRFWGPNQKTVAVIFRPKSPNRSCRFWDPNQETLHRRFWGQTGRNRRHPFWGQTGRNRHHRFWGQNGRNRSSSFEAKLPTSHPSGFEVKPLTNRRPWFWGSTKKSTLIVSSCMVHTAHNVTRPLDHPATKYPTCATIPILCTRSPTPAMVLVAARHAAPATCTPWDKQTRFSTRNKDKGKTIEMSRIRIQIPPSLWFITIKPRNRPLGFSISPLMSLLTIESTKFKVWIQDLMKHS
jgi:hypothetical protein